MEEMDTMWEGDLEVDVEREDMLDMYEPFGDDPATEARDFELGAFGDPRRCPRHPHVKTSSDDGMFDAPCDLCEAEMEESAKEWDYDTENPNRPFCSLPVGPWGSPRHAVGCADVPDEIPF